MNVPKTIDEIYLLHGSIESRELEFKGFNIESKSLPKSENILKTIQGMMNGTELKCCIILGLKEINGKLDRDSITPISFPCNIDGQKCQPKTFDEYRRHLYQYINDHTMPYYEGLVTIHKIDIDANQYLIAIEVTQSTERPHQNTNGHRYIRRDGYTDQMSYQEVEIAVFEKRARLNLLSTESNQIPLMDIAASEITIPLNGLPFANLEPFGDTSRSRNVSLLEGAYIFLTLTPAQKRSLSPHDLRNLLKQSGLPPLGDYTSWWTEINERGAVVFQETAHDETKAYNLTQVNRDGSIEGVDTYIVNPYYARVNDDIDFPYLPISSVEGIFVKAMRMYLTFAEKSLQLDLPLKFKAGVVGIKNYKLAIPKKAFQSPFVGKSVDDVIDQEGIIISYTQSAEEILIPFFEKIWKTFGQQRPTISK